MDLLKGLGAYCLVVVAGLLCQMLIVYPLLLRLWTPLGWKTFLKAWPRHSSLPSPPVQAEPPFL